MVGIEELTLNNTNNIIIKKNEKSNFNDARCSINAFFLCREENVQKV